jgi:hypothetical protein
LRQKASRERDASEAAGAAEGGGGAEVPAGHAPRADWGSGGQWWLRARASSFIAARNAPHASGPIAREAQAGSAAAATACSSAARDSAGEPSQPPRLEAAGSVMTCARACMHERSERCGE